MYSLIIVYLVGGLCALIAISIAIIALVKAWRDYKQAQSTKDWRSTNGQITESPVEEMSEGGGDGPRLFCIRLRYTYQVAGIQYEGSRIYAGDDPFGSQEAMQDLSARYQNGMRVDVHYNPLNPADAVLHTRSKSSTKALIFAIVFLVVAACIVCMTLSYPLLVKY